MTVTSSISILIIISMLRCSLAALWRERDFLSKERELKNYFGNFSNAAKNSLRIFSQFQEYFLTYYLLKGRIGLNGELESCSCRSDFLFFCRSRFCLFYNFPPFLMVFFFFPPSLLSISFQFMLKLRLIFILLNDILT